VGQKSKLLILSDMSIKMRGYEEREQIRTATEKNEALSDIFT